MKKQDKNNKGKIAGGSKYLHFGTKEGKIIHLQESNENAVAVEILDVFHKYLSDPDFIEMVRLSMVAHSRRQESDSHKILRSDLTLNHPGGYSQLKKKWEKAADLLIRPQKENRNFSNGKHGGTGKVVFHNARWYEHTASSY
jgi:hypothetical protein